MQEAIYPAAIHIPRIKKLGILETQSIRGPTGWLNETIWILVQIDAHHGIEEMILVRLEHVQK